MLACLGFFGLAGACPTLILFSCRKNSKASQRKVNPTIPKMAETVFDSTKNAQISNSNPSRIQMITAGAMRFNLDSSFHTITCPNQMVRKVVTAVIIPMGLIIPVSF
jgi:hypothetical protein